MILTPGGATADETPIGARGETANSKNQVMTYPDTVLCWDLVLEALPTHRLPWAGFGLRQPHWPMVSARFY